MNVYIWRNVDRITGREHGGGGLVIIGDDYAAAWQAHRDAAIAKGGATEDQWQPDHIRTELPEPDITLALAEPAEPEVVVFPDAGCC